MSLGNQISILEGEVDEKSTTILKLQGDIQNHAREHKNEMNSVRASNNQMKFTLEKANSEISEYMTKNTEWDIMMSKRGNEIQELKLENFSLKKTLNEQVTKIAPMSTNNTSKKNNTSKSEVSKEDTREPDVVFMHDSLGRPIKEGILKNQNLKTTKEVTYYVEDSIKHLKENVTTPPKAFVVHAGTNNLAKRKQTPNQIIALFEELVECIRTKFPGSKLVYSSIVPREDNREIQRSAEFINAAMNMKFGGEKDVIIVRNNDIKGSKMKSRDGIHLKEDGTRCLARHIRDGVKSILNIK